LLSFSLSFSYSETYFTIPFSIPNEPIVFPSLKKSFSWPIKNIPFVPRYTATIFVEINLANKLIAVLIPDQVSVDFDGLTVTVAKYLTPNGTDINKSGIIPDIEVKMNINPILQREIGTRKDKQYRAGEKELVNIIKRNNQISEFNPNSTNLNAFLKINKKDQVFALN